MDSYNDQRKWADSFIPQILERLNPCVGKMVTITTANEEDDHNHDTDLVINMDVGTIATRVRKPHGDDRDLTIRSTSKYGGKTELSKIKEGFARWYFYGWIDGDQITEWMVVDLNILREANPWDNYEEIPNTDGTKFKAIPYSDLKKFGCIVDSKIKEPNL